VAEKDWIGSNHETPESSTYVGLPRSEALDIARQRNVELVRVFEWSIARYTMDYCPTRLTLLVKDDVIVRAAFF
jgi:hypothetical protein